MGPAGGRRRKKKGKTWREPNETARPKAGKKNSVEPKFFAPRSPTESCRRLFFFPNDKKNETKQNKPGAVLFFDRFNVHFD